MSESDDSDTFPVNDFKNVQEEIRRCKNNPATSGMFVSGWDDADEGVVGVDNPAANPSDHVLWAAEHGHVDILERVLSSEPPLVHARDDDGYTALHRAAYGNHVAAVSYLLARGADVAARTQLGWTPLHSACNWNNYAVAARLLAAGADPLALSDGEMMAEATRHAASSYITIMRAPTPPSNKRSFGQAKRRVDDPSSLQA